jgi:hypothetical protein
VKHAHREWRGTMGQEKDYLLLSLGYAEAPFEVTVLALKDFERRFLRHARAPSERLLIRRLTTKDILAEAFIEGRSWADFGPHLRRMKQLGYPNLWMRVFIACIYVQSLALFPDQARDAFAMLNEAERRVRRMKKNRRFRQQLLDGIAQARDVAASQEVQPIAARRRK